MTLFSASSSSSASIFDLPKKKIPVAHLSAIFHTELSHPRTPRNRDGGPHDSKVGVMLRCYPDQSDAHCTCPAPVRHSSCQAAINPGFSDSVSVVRAKILISKITG